MQTTKQNTFIIVRSYRPVFVELYWNRHSNERYMFALIRLERNKTVCWLVCSFLSFTLSVFIIFEKIRGIHILEAHAKFLAFQKTKATM